MLYCYNIRVLYDIIEYHLFVSRTKKKNKKGITIVSILKTRILQLTKKIINKRKKEN